MAKRNAHHGRLPTRADAARKPLIGFGWAGWVLLPVLIGLVAVVVTGYDLRYRIQELVLQCFGLDALFDFTIYGLVHTGLVAGSWPPRGTFGPITLIIVLVALQVHPRRVGLVPLGLLYTFGLLGPAAMFWFTLGPLRDWRGSLTGTVELGTFIWLGLASALLFITVRRKRVALLACCCLGLPVLVQWIGNRGTYGQLPYSFTVWSERVEPWMGPTMHLGLAVVLWAWAIRARLHPLATHCCQSCGYDLRGLPSAPCPECGTPSEQAVDSAVSAGDPEPSQHVLQAGSDGEVR